MSDELSTPRYSAVHAASGSGDRAMATQAVTASEVTMFHPRAV